MRILRFSSEHGVQLLTPEQPNPSLGQIIRRLGEFGIVGAEIPADPSSVTDITPRDWPASDAKYWLSRQEEGGPVRIDFMPRDDDSDSVRNVIVNESGQLDTARTPLRTITVPGTDKLFMLNSPGPGNRLDDPYLFELIVPVPDDFMQ